MAEPDAPPTVPDAAGSAFDPGQVVAIVNDRGGSDDEVIAEALRAAGVRVEPMGPSIEDQIAAAVGDGAAVIAVAGGDGSLRSAAAALAGTDTVLLPVAAGTKNHFAHAVGVPTVEDSLAALRGGDVVDVPLARLGEQLFLNTAVIGWYPQLVDTRERLRKVVPRPVVAALAALRHAPVHRPFDVAVDGTPDRVWMIWIGNGQYGLTPDELAERESLTDGVVDLRLLRATRRFARLRVAWALATKRLDDSPELERDLHRDPVHLVINNASPAGDDPNRVLVALDAEPDSIPADMIVTPAATSVKVLVNLAALTG